MSDEQKALLKQALIRKRSVLSPPRLVPLSEWAEENLRVTGALQGRYKVANAPYQREVFDALTDSKVGRVVIMAASQMLKTQALLAYLGYIIDREPGPTLVVQPTGKMAGEFAKDRIGHLLETTSCLRTKFESKSRRDSGNTTTHKKFPGGSLSVAVAGSVSDLASRAIKYLLMDEVDRYETTREGDPVSLAEKRTSTFWDSKIVLVSSPGDESSRIAAEYENSDKRIYEVKCPSCGEYEEMAWAQVKWDDDKTKGTHERASTAYYECPRCQAQWDEADRLKAVQHGRWTQTNPASPVAGFRISALASPFTPLQKLVLEHYEALGDPEKRRAFTNTRLAETFKDISHSFNPNVLLGRAESYSPQKLPNDIAIITAGVDIQADRIECEVVGWGVGDENWSIDYHVLSGNTLTEEPWEQLATVLSQTFAREDGVQLKINATCMDCQGQSHQEAFNFAFKYKNLNIYPIRGVPGENKMIFRKKAKRMSRFRHGNYYEVGTFAAKERHYAMLKVEEPGPLYCHFPVGYSDGYFEGLTAEVLKLKLVKGRRVRNWEVKPGIRNEPMDCRVYAMAARASISVDLAEHNKRLTEKHKQGTEEPEQKVEKEQPKQAAIQRPPPPPSGGWMSGSGGF